jgi:hypothetical protein
VPGWATVSNNVIRAIAEEVSRIVWPDFEDIITKEST